MSTGCNCFFVETAPGRWYYVLEDRNAPKNAWDWRENAQAYGPFASEEATYQHLHANHANPGGFYCCPCENGQPSYHGLDAEPMKSLIANASSESDLLRGPIVRAGPFLWLR